MWQFEPVLLRTRRHPSCLTPPRDATPSFIYAHLILGSFYHATSVFLIGDLLDIPFFLLHRVLPVMLGDISKLISPIDHLQNVHILSKLNPDIRSKISSFYVI